jgi:hypothetical protein
VRFFDIVYPLKTKKARPDQVAGGKTDKVNPLKRASLVLVNFIFHLITPA